MNHPGGRERLYALGVRHVPVLARGSEYVTCQIIANVAKFVGIVDYREIKLAPDELMRKWLIALSAGQRYIRQYPAARLDTRLIEKRDQSVHHMGYHVFRIGHAFLQSVLNGVADWVPVSMEMPPPAMKSGDDIAAYGETVKQQLSEWWNALADKSCKAEVRVNTGAQPLRDFLERQTWHSAQHVRQLMAILERLNIAPDTPVTDKDLASLPMPKGVWE